MLVYTWDIPDYLFSLNHKNADDFTSGNTYINSQSTINFAKINGLGIKIK